MKILAIDAATEACSAALLLDGDVLERYEIAPQRHTQLLMPMVHELLAEVGLGLGAIDAFAFGHGPGSFTGLRIATGLIQGLAMGVNRPVIGISTLAALARQAFRQHHAGKVAAAIDARMGQVYWGLYEQDTAGLLRPLAADTLLNPDQVPVLGTGEWYAIGSGWGAYMDSLLLASRLGAVTPEANAFPHAADIAYLAVPVLRQGGGVAAASVAPVYLRDQVAQKMHEVRK